jgi:glycosyltransferase involved in cell wall biosynthesis
MKHPIISIIIPVYNAEKYLQKCVDSVLTQTFSDFELLLIDDGSSDGSGKICDEYAQQDNRIKVFHKKNGGVSSARNLGLDNATGEWITFIDSDDWVADNFLEVFYNFGNLNEDCLYLQQTQTFFKGEYHESFKSIPGLVSLNNIKNTAQLDVILKFGTPWSKLFNFKIIKDNCMRFDENLSLHEDHCFYFEYILYINTIYVYNNVGYFYLGEGSHHLTAAKNLPDHQKLNSAYLQLKTMFSKIAQKVDISCENLRVTNDFIFSINLIRLRSVFYYPNSKEIRIRVLNDINVSHRGGMKRKIEKILLYILRLKSVRLKYFILITLRKLLRR